MHCPNCGKPATPDQQFCRSCGMSLESVEKLVAQHSSSIAASPTKLEKVRQEQAIVQHMFRWLSIGMIIIGLGVLMLVLNRSLDLGRWFGSVTSVLLIGGIGVASFGVLNAIRKNASLHLGNGPKELPLTSTDQSLPTNRFPESLPSVTDGTTQLIARVDEQERSSN